jgi:hypothetical protein
MTVPKRALLPVVFLLFARRCRPSNRPSPALTVRCGRAGVGG